MLLFTMDYNFNKTSILMFFISKYIPQYSCSHFYQETVRLRKINILDNSDYLILLTQSTFETSCDTLRCTVKTKSLFLCHIQGVLRKIAFDFFYPSADFFASLMNIFFSSSFNFARSFTNQYVSGIIKKLFGANIFVHYS